MKSTALRHLAAPLLLLFAAGAMGQAPAPSTQDGPARRPKIGLALGGGGARGAAHIGVLKVLEELRIPIDYIAGTSMGSVVGGLYVVGYSPESLDEIITKVDWGTLFIDAAPRADVIYRRKENDYFVPPGVTLGVKKGSLVFPAGLVAGRKLSFLLNTLTLPDVGIHDFDKLPIPFRAVATDARTGQPIVLSEGSLPRAIRASMAIPVVFTPVEYEGHLLIDGGEAENLPVQTVLAMGADVVIAVDVASSSEIPKEAPASMTEMLGRLIDLPLLRNTLESRKLATLVITPDLKGFSSGDFPKAGQIIPRGETAARADAEKLRQWSVPEEEYRAWQKAHRATLPDSPPMIDEVVVDPIKGFDTRRITRILATKAGQPFNEQVLQDDMRRIAGMTVFQDVEFRFDTADGRDVLHIVATPKSWGPTYLSAGIDFDISDANADFDISLLLDATEMNRLGGNWKTSVDVGTNVQLLSAFFQPLDYAGRFFVSPRVGWDQRPVDVFIDEEAVAQYRVRQGKVGFDVGMELGHLLSLGEFSVGIERGTGNAQERIGNPDYPDLDVDTGAFVSRLRIDQLDSVWFPTTGYFANVEFSGSRTALGASVSNNRGSILAFGATTLGRWTGLVRVTYADSFGSTLPLYSRFPLGGFLNLSGRPINQLAGSTLGFGSLVMRYRLTKNPGALVKGIYVGASVEVGNVWPTRNEASISDLRNAGSVFFVADTIIGPIYLAYGNSGSKNQAGYLFMNRRF
jgi:NTE family protein